MMIEYRKHYRHWKAIHEAFPSLTMEEVKDHATAFFNRVNSHRSNKITMLDFIRKHPLDYFKGLTFDKPSPKQVGEDKESPADKDLDHSNQKNQSDAHSEGEKKQAEDKKSEECKRSAEEVKEEQVKENPRAVQSPRYMPTQSKVMTNALKGSTAEMMKLMQSLVNDLQSHEEEMQKFPNVAGYWGYIYNSAVYLQQIINDVTVAHNSTLNFLQETKICYGHGDSLI